VRKQLAVEAGIVLRTAMLVVAFAVALAFAGGASFAAAPPPPGATAQCRDGSYSYSQHHSGTCSYHGGVAKWLDGATTSKLTGVTAGFSAPSLGRLVLLTRRTRSSRCVRGALPDRRCSPGAYYNGLTKAVICSSSFRTGTIRNVPQSEKYAVERGYGMPTRLYGDTIEIDHIVSLELGGANDISNLFPEPGSGAANYHVKDKLENRLHEMVCAGRITLANAQRGIAGNWKALYRLVFGTPPS
jgi:uncharacterized protein DUF3761